MSGRDMSRAERFEDEKRRIIESCFSKRDEDGSILETYITHIRITEFQTSPTAPPPPSARVPQNEKPRIIIVAVRKSGRVRVHKSKENSNGTFSIGKTWNLDDLSSIESFTGPTPIANYKQWAGDVGFVVTLGKPYYWEAQTDKEKKFFIASLIKIYNKYTGGRTPLLTGFEQRELDQVLNGAQVRRQPDRPSPRPAPLEPAPNSTTVSLSSAYNIPPSTSSSTPSVTGVPDRPPTSRSVMGTANGPSSSPAQSFDSGRPPMDPSLRRLGARNQSQDSVAASITARSDDGTSSLRPSTRNGMNGSSPFLPPESPIPQPEDKPPERRRPPMDPLRTLQTDRDLVPAPLMSPGMRREPVPPPRSSERVTGRKESFSRRNDSLATGSDVGSPKDSTPDLLGRTSTSTLPTSPPDPPTPQSAPPAEEASPPKPPPEPEEPVKPGLGPMIKAKKSKGEIAGALWKAASAATAFKPRPGGAAERLLKKAEKPNDGPDGITGVIPAPKPVQKPPEPAPAAAQGDPAKSNVPAVPELKVTETDGTQRPESGAEPAPAKEKPKKDELLDEEEERRRSIVVGNDAKYLATLGIDPSLLNNNKTTEFAKWLDYFGWVPGEKMRTRTFDDVRADLDRELSRAQAGGWLARFQEEDERVEAIKRGIDLAISECDELDNLLTLYSVELSTLSSDIAYIEAQGQGLQVQAANQKLLKKELESLLETCAINQSDLDVLRTAPLETAAGVEEIEAALVTLFKAMIKIDPTLGNSDARASEDANGDHALGLESDYGKMRIVQEKKEMYRTESAQFMRRLVIFMERQFSEAYAETKRALDGALSKKADARNHEAGRDLLWMYSPLILYARDVDLDNWDRILQVYQDRSHPVYKAEFKDAMEAWKKNARRAMGDESELLFTAQQEKKEEGLSTTARKLTVKRSQTLARLRSPLLDGSRSSDKTPDGKFLPHEVFAGVLDDLLPLAEMEQNFIVDFFHATTLEQTDFPELVAAARPQDRRGGDLRRHRLMEPDRDLARRVTKAMEAIFSFLETSLQQLIDWALSLDPLQGVGILATLERKMADMSQSNQDFLNNVLQKLHGNLETRFKKFVDDQVRAIEETKVKIKKRKGVISFVRIFPHFATAIENMLVNVDPALPIRKMVDREYDRVLKSMFDSLRVIARENPALGSAGGPATSSANLSSSAASTTTTITAASSASADPEDKEALNFHILLIENMNHFLEEVPAHTSGSTHQPSFDREVLADWRETAQRELHEHLQLYLAAVMRRPLGKLLEHLENIEAQLQAGKAPSMIAAQPSNSKTVFNKVLGQYDAKEVRKGIEALRKRVEKHFGDDDESSSSSVPRLPGLSPDTASSPGGLLTPGGGGGGGGAGGEGSGGAANASLVNRVLRECERFYGEVEMRIGKVTTDVYGGDVLFEWPRQEVKVAFSGIGR